MELKGKRGSVGLEIKSFKGRSGNQYVVLRTPKGSYHVLVEVEAKAAARDCGVKINGTTRQEWASLWPER